MYSRNIALRTALSTAAQSRGSFTLELGMPHLGRNNLSESALFKALGHDRWRQIENAGRIQSNLICDEAGSRLYATFFFLEVNLPRQMPLSAFGENSFLIFNTDLSHFSKVHLDGWYSLAEHPEFGVRASNVFIHQEHGPSKLSLAAPVNVDFSGIAELSTPPDSLDLCRKAKTEQAFFAPSADDVALYDGEREYAYQIDPDRDLNGAGLIYFANFISFLDLAERRILSNMKNAIPPELVDTRSTYQRRIGYFGNARSTDCLHIFMKARLRIAGNAEHRFVDFGFDHRIVRSSDDKEIVLSSCRKVAPFIVSSDTTWARSWIPSLAALS